MTRVGIVTNPFDPSTWEEHHADDPRQLLVERFASWPSTARIYDLEGFGDWKRAAALLDPSVLSARDVTPRDEAGIDRLATIRGPLLVTIPPADPLTAIIAVVAIAVGVAAAFLLMPKLPSAGRQPSPNNSLSDRANQARPNQRIPDIFGTVEATPDLLMVPYTVFENNREVEVAYMGVGRGSYTITRVRDGDTALASIAGASAAIYGPGTSPNSGSAPQLQIGAPIPEPVQTVVKLNEVNGQTLKPTNLNQVQGEDSIRFVYPDQIETNDSDIDFTKYFDAGDAIAVQQADISGSSGVTTIAASARFTSAGVVEFTDLDPSATFAVGGSVTISNAGYAGDNGSGGVLYVDLSGTYQISAITGPAATRYTNFNVAPWTRNSCTVAANTIPGPNGEAATQTVTATGDPFSLIFKAEEPGRTLRVVMKKGTAAWAYVYADKSGLKGTWFNLETGAIGTDQLNGTIQALGDGWFACSVQQPADGSGNAGFGLADADNGQTASAGMTVHVASAEVSDAGSRSITLFDPASVNADWNALAQFPDGRTDYRQPTFSVARMTDGINLNGNYTILALTSSTITLNNPALVNESWNNLADLDEQATDYVSPNISRSSESWIGPYIVDLDDATQLLANIVGTNGLFTLSKKKGQQRALTVGVVLEVTPVNQNDAATGPAQLFPGQITGSDTERTSVGLSLYATPTFAGRSSIRMRRTTPTPSDDDYGSVVDEVKWRDAYGLAPIEQTDFGDVTTVMTRTVATSGALSIKNRKLNMRVTRRVPARISGGAFGAPVASDNAADIMAAMALDPFIGRRAPEEVDFENLYDTIAEVMDYFGSPLAGQFGFTFDDTDVSFEETLQTVAQAVFCRGYRQGRVVRLAFERATNESSLIFNARNIMPGSQKRTVRLGPLDDHDGVELDWIDPQDGAAQTFKVPTDRSATSPRSADVPGVRSYLLAYWQAWRAWNKVRYQNIAVELEATQEAALVIPNDRVLIADRTRPGIIQGEVEEQVGLTLKLSTPAALDPAKRWTVFIQHTDETIEALGVTPGDDDLHVTLSAAPRSPLSLDPANFARATYIIVPDDDVQTRAFLITEREPQSNFTESVRAVNYSFLYYQHDQLDLWVPIDPFSIYDAGPHLWDVEVPAGYSITTDDSRGPVLLCANQGYALSFGNHTMPESYTKAVWLSPTQLGGERVIMNAEDAVERFQFVDSGLRAGHGGVQLYAAWPEGGWHHAAVTYDAESGLASLYIDGVEVDTQPLPARNPVKVYALGGFEGRADDIRVWTRALEPSEIKSVYLSTKRVTGSA